MTAILIKELRGRMRGRAAGWLLTLYVGLLALITVLFYALVDENVGYGPRLAAMGVEVFALLNIFQTALTMLVGPLLTAGAIAGEKDRQTYELLRSTRLTPLDILAGKLVAGIAFMLLLIVAAVPVLSTAFLFGGISPVPVLRSVAVQVVTAVLMGAGGLFFSTLVGRTSTAGALGIVLAGVLGIGTILFGLWTPPLGAVPRPDGRVSPGVVFYEKGPVGMTLRMVGEPGTGARPILPVLFYLNPGLGIFSAATVEGMPGEVIPAGLVHELNRASGDVPVWAGYLMGATGLAAIFFAGAWWQLDPPAARRLLLRGRGPLARRWRNGRAEA